MLHLKTFILTLLMGILLTSVNQASANDNRFYVYNARLDQGKCERTRKEL